MLTQTDTRVLQNIAAAGGTINVTEPIQHTVAELVADGAVVPVPDCDNCAADTPPCQAPLPGQPLGERCVNRHTLTDHGRDLIAAM